MSNLSPERYWRETLLREGRRDPLAAAGLALQFLFTGSPFSEILTLVARRDSSLTGATTVLIGKAADSPVTVMPKVPHGMVLVLDELDVRVDDNAGAVAGDTVLADLSLQFLKNGQGIRQIPTFTVDKHACGKFGAVKKRMILGSEDELKVNLVEASSGGTTYDVYLSIVARLEPKWLYQLAYLYPLSPEQQNLAGV